MHMAPRAAAWVAWAVWTCNSLVAGPRLAAFVLSKRKERTSVRSFFFETGIQPDSPDAERRPGCSIPLGSGRLRRLPAVT